LLLLIYRRFHLQLFSISSGFKFYLQYPTYFVRNWNTSWLRKHYV